MPTIDWILAHPYEAITTTLAFTTMCVVGIRAAIPALTKLADHTSSKADNEFLLRLTPKLDAVIAVLDIVRRILPRVVVGPLPSTQPIASATGRVTVPSLGPPQQPLSAPPLPRVPTLPYAPSKDDEVRKP